MPFLQEITSIEIFICFGIVFWIFYKYVTKNYNYWKKRGVPYVDVYFPFGTLWDVMLGQKNIREGMDRCYNQFKDERYFGILNGRKPTLIVNDLDLIKQILIKDFRYFSDRSPLTSAQKKEYIINHLFNMSGKEWKDMRMKLTPTFTSGKMKMMFSLLEKCSEQLRMYLNTQVSTNAIIDAKDILTIFTMDTIASCAFGLDINCFSDRNCEFYTFGTQILRPTIPRMIRRVWYSVLPVFSLLYAPPTITQNITEFFTKIIHDTISYRDQNSITRNDFLDLLIKIRQNKNVLDEEDKITQRENDVNLENKESDKKPALTIEEITAQSFVFFIAGFETASSTASFCLYELACNQDVQNKLFQEIKEVLKKHGGCATYQALQEMCYLNQVINETLRLYPSLSVLNRTCTETYRIPDSNLILEKGTKVDIPISAIQRDPRYFPEPYKFDPDRFSVESMRMRHPFVHLPFGEGPRMCIGMRFGLLQTKVALITMLSNYHFDKTPDTEVPIKLNKRAVVTLPEKPLLLHVTKRTV